MDFARVKPRFLLHIAGQRMAPINKVTKMLSSSILVMVLFVCVFAPQNSYSQTAELSHRDQMCAKVWKDIWPRAKNGDLEARFDLLTAIVAGPDVEPFQMPGSTGSWIDTYRDIVIMGVHTSNYFLLNEKSTDPKMIENYQTLVMQFANLIVRDGNGRGAQFLNCVAEKKESCDDVAIKEGFVPDFKEYAQQIDKNIQSGVQGSCKSYFKSKN